MHDAAPTPAWVLIAYLIAGVCFILALRGLSSPETSRRGNRAGMLGMGIAVATTLAIHDIASLGEIVGEGHGTLLVAPWRHDGHPDHDAAGRAAARVAASSGARLVEYPLLMWHRLQPDEAPWEQMAVLRLDEASLETKLAAIRAHASQIRGAGGAPAPLDGRFLGHFTVPLEHLVLATEPAPRPPRGQDPVAVVTHV